MFGQPQKKRKTLALISQDEVLDHLCKQIDDRVKSLDDHVRMLKRNLDVFQQRINTENIDDLVLIESRLKDLDLLPDGYNKQTHQLTFEYSQNAIEVLTDV